MFVTWCTQLLLTVRFEDIDGDDAPNTADTVHRDGVQRIVDLHMHLERDAEYVVYSWWSATRGLFIMTQNTRGKCYAQNAYSYINLITHQQDITEVQEKRAAHCADDDSPPRRENVAPGAQGNSSWKEEKHGG